MRPRIFPGIILLSMLILPGAEAGRKGPCATVEQGADVPAEPAMSYPGFNADRAANALAYLEHTLPDLIENARTAEEIVQSEFYYIGRPNAVLRLKGYLLRLEYERARLALALARCREESVAVEEEKWEAAREALCDFLARPPLLTD